MAATVTNVDQFQLPTYAPGSTHHWYAPGSTHHWCQIPLRLSFKEYHKQAHEQREKKCRSIQLFSCLHCVSCLRNITQCQHGGHGAGDTLPLRGDAIASLFKEYHKQFFCETQCPTGSCVKLTAGGQPVSQPASPQTS